jgi:hypothetical protein
VDEQYKTILEDAAGRFKSSFATNTSGIKSCFVEAGFNMIVDLFNKSASRCC